MMSRLGLCRPVLLLIALLLAACSNSTADRQAVERVVELRAQALATRDITLLVSLISTAYYHDGKDYAAKWRDLAGLFATVERFDYRPERVEITVNGDQATVRSSYELRLVKGGKSYRFNGEEVLQLAREEGVWRIVAGL